MFTISNITTIDTNNQIIIIIHSLVVLLSKQSTGYMIKSTDVHYSSVYVLAALVCCFNNADNETHSDRYWFSCSILNCQWTRY